MSCNRLGRWSNFFKPLVVGWLFRSVVFLALPMAVQATQSVLLAWNPSPDPSVVGYKIHFGTISHSYTELLDVGSATNATIVLPSPGTTYYFAATAYDASGVESEFSNEISFTLPAEARLTAAGLVAGQFSFTVTGTPGVSYVVEASTNLADWFPVQTNVAPFQFVDLNPAGLSQCFYRSVAR